MFGGEGEGSDGGMQELTTTVPAGTAAKRLSPMTLMESRGTGLSGTFSLHSEAGRGVQPLGCAADVKYRNTSTSREGGRFSTCGR